MALRITHSSVVLSWTTWSSRLPSKTLWSIQMDGLRRIDRRAELEGDLAALIDLGSREVLERQQRRRQWLRRHGVAIHHQRGQGRVLLGVEAGGNRKRAQRIAARRAGLDQHLDPLARREDDLVAGPRLIERVAVFGNLVELVTIQLQEECQVRRRVQDPPALRLARPDRHRRVELAVDQAQIGLLHVRARRHVQEVDHAAVGVELRRVEHQQPLGDPGDARQGVDVAFDDDRSRHAAEDLVGRPAVQVRVVPVETGRVVRPGSGTRTGSSRRP